MKQKTSFLRALVLGVLLSIIFMPKVIQGAEFAQTKYQINPYYTVPEPCSKYIPEIEKYPWNTVTAIKIMYLESKCNPKAKNLKDSHKGCMGSYSLMQLVK